MLSKGGGSSIVAQPDWGDYRRTPDFNPEIGKIPGPLPQPGPGGSGGKWECKYVNEPSKPDWGGIFDRPTPGNI